MNNDTFILELGQQHIKIADFKVTPSKLIPLAAGIQKTSANFYLSQAEDITKSVGDTVKKLMSEANIVKKNVIVLIPESHSFTSIKEMPSLTEKELISAIRYQADQFIPMPMDKVNLDIEILQEDKKNKKLLTLLVAAPIVLTERIVEFVEGLGLFPVVLENEASASSRFFNLYLQSQKTDSKASPAVGSTVVIHFGYSASTIYLLDLAHKIPVQIHTVNTGVELFVRAIRTNLQLDDVKSQQLLEKNGLGMAPGNIDINKIVSPVYTEFIEEVKRYFLSIQDDKVHSPVQNVLLYGHGAKLIGIEKKIQESIGIRTEILNPAVFLENNQVTESLSTEWVSFIPLMGSALR